MKLNKRSTKDYEIGSSARVYQLIDEKFKVIRFRIYRVKVKKYHFYICLSKKLGLGIEPNEEALKKYPLKPKKQRKDTLLYSNGSIFGE